ncbi:MAG: YhjD/YihY/BrkB family envelope integrity protein, partial [Anaerolineales bacterium]|nr:YhjD/YihY/BrkB family envelope integrity protein [Anaerolineales bacterium]
MWEKLKAFIKDFSIVWTTKTPARQAAALAYYSMFSLAPVIFVAISISELLFQSVDFTSEIYSQIELTFGAEAANFLRSLVSGVAEPNNGIAGGGTSPIITLISVGALLYAATGLFYHLQYSLDLIWGVPWQVEGGFLIVVRSRLIAFLLVIGLGLVLVLLEVINVAFLILRSFPLFEGLVPAVDMIVLVGVQVVFFMLFYKFLPRVPVAWRDVVVGS